MNAMELLKKGFRFQKVILHFGQSRYSSLSKSNLVRHESPVFYQKWVRLYSAAAETPAVEQKPAGQIEQNAQQSETNARPSYTMKQRPIKQYQKKSNASASMLNSTTLSYKVKAYCTADYYDMEGLKKCLVTSGAYEIFDIDKQMPENFLCFRTKYQAINEIEPRHMFFFLDGAVVFWNFSREEQNSILDILSKHEKNPYPSRFVNEEVEMLTYSRIIRSNQHPTDDFSRLNLTRLVNSHIYFADANEPNNMFNLLHAQSKEHLLEKYAFSDAMALSVKLGIWEKNLDEFSERIDFIADDLKLGKNLKITNEEVLKYLGELLTMRHVINLHSNFLDFPDFYWDREHLEALYSQLYSHLSISKRTRLFNERLNHCVDLMEILKQHLNDKKHTRLEWIIIGLITIEVLIALDFFEILKNISIRVFNAIKS